MILCSHSTKAKLGRRAEPLELECPSENPYEGDDKYVYAGAHVNVAGGGRKIIPRGQAGLIWGFRIE